MHMDDLLLCNNVFVVVVVVVITIIIVIVVKCAHHFTHFPALAISAHNNGRPKHSSAGPKPTTSSSTWRMIHCSWMFERRPWLLSPVAGYPAVVAAAGLQRLHSRSWWSSLSYHVVISSADRLMTSCLACPNLYLSSAPPLPNWRTSKHSVERQW